MAMALQQQDDCPKRRESSTHQSNLNSCFRDVNKPTGTSAREGEDYSSKPPTKRMKPTMQFGFESDEFRMLLLDWYRHQTATYSLSTKKKALLLVTPPPPTKGMKPDTTVTTNASTSTTT